MQKLEQILETIARYRGFEWKLRRVLVQAELRPAIEEHLSGQSVPFFDSDFNALWFSRPSGSNREAWELRLISDAPYALFETFEADETEEQRDEFRSEMEATLREHLSRG